MNNLETQILGELQERKEGQKAINETLNHINQKVWVATGFIICLQIVLQIVLKYALK